MLSCRPVSEEVGVCLVKELNALRRSVPVVASYYHADCISTQTGNFQGGYTVTNQTVTAASATTLATAIARINQLNQFYLAHIAEATFTHSVADATNTVASTTITARAAALVRANALYTAYNAHLTQSTVHFNNDTNAVSDSTAVVTMSGITAAGSSPPTVTISGTPADVVVDGTNALQIAITTGAVGSSITDVRFKWSADAGVTWTTDVVGANTVLLGTTGITAAFAHGGGDTYSTDNTYKASTVITTLTTRVNDLVAAFNTHVASKPAGHGIQIVGA